MADQLPPTHSSSDEIDLGQLFKLIQNGFNKLGNVFLRVFLYLKKNIVILLGLLVSGVIASFLLNMLVPQKMKTEILVKPNFESENYLYSAVDEIQSHINTKDTVFLSNLGIDVESLKGYGVNVEPVGETDEEPDKDRMKLEMQYLELLQNFKDQNFALDIIRSELSRKSVLNHKITFTYKNAQNSGAIAKKIIDYLNNNTFFEKIRNVEQENAVSRIQNNRALIEQIDELIANYSKGLLQQTPDPGEGTVLMENEEGLNVPGLLSLKNVLAKDIEERKIIMAQQTDALTVIHMGKSQHIKKPFFNKRIVALPMYLILAFLTFSLIKYLNRKSKEL